MLRSVLLLCVCVLLVSCGGGGEASNPEEYGLRPVTLPDGTVIKAEVNTNKIDMARGMMFRDSFPEGRGMLFIHGTAGKYPYWMYQVKIPLDIVWMDARGKIVEISENTPPCPGPSSQCATYGGTKDAMVVLELPGGYGRRHAVRVGDVIRF